MPDDSPHDKEGGRKKLGKRLGLQGGEYEA